MDAQQIEHVRTSYEALRGKQDQFADLFYDRLFALDPSTRALFSDIETQKRSLLRTVDVIVEHLDNTDVAVPFVTELGQRHATYGVKAYQYSSAGAAWYWALDQTLGDAFSMDVKLAWTAAFCLLAKIMLDAPPPEKDSAGDIQAVQQPTR